MVIVMERDGVTAEVYPDLVDEADFKSPSQPGAVLFRVWDGTVYDVADIIEILYESHKGEPQPEADSG